MRYQAEKNSKAGDAPDTIELEVIYHAFIFLKDQASKVTETNNYKANPKLNFDCRFKEGNAYADFRNG